MGAREERSQRAQISVGSKLSSVAGGTTGKFPEDDFTACVKSLKNCKMRNYVNSSLDSSILRPHLKTIIVDMDKDFTRMMVTRGIRGWAKDKRD